jgi:hypothetical protein
LIQLDADKLLEYVTQNENSKPTLIVRRIELLLRAISSDISKVLNSGFDKATRAKYATLIRF